MATASFELHDQSWKIEVEQNFNQLEQELNILKESLSSPPLAIKQFNQVRNSYKSLEWTFLPLSRKINSSIINSSKFWVWQDSIFVQNYEEAGTLQLIEKYLSKGQVKTTALQQAIQATEKFITTWRKVWLNTNVSEVEVLYAIAVDLEQQYLLTLSGYDRLDTQQTKLEFNAVITNYEQQISQLNVPSLKAFLTNKPFRKLKKQVKKNTFESLDRASLYKNEILPIYSQLIELLTAQSPTPPPWLSHLNLAQKNLFGEGGLRPSAFHQLRYEGNKTQLIQLGELLFYEPMLSGNNKRTCASCHKPQKAFSDGRQTSMGFDISKRVLRNSPSLLNATFSHAFSHDMSKLSLQDQIISVIYHPQEFRTTTPTIIKKLNSSSTYQQYFKACFPQTAQIDSTQVFDALIAYMGQLNAFDSPFDHYMRGQNDTLAQTILLGYNLFMGKGMCGSCHFPPLFSGLKPMAYQTQEYHSHGVSSHILLPKKADPDPGLVKSHNTNEKYKYMYKTPSLRNLEITGPYMHNGIFPELDQVLNFIHTGNNPSQIPASFPAGTTKYLSINEKLAIKEFLKNLNITKLDRYQEKLELPTTDGSLAPVHRRASGVY